MTAAIAIVGMACIYPDARSTAALWENVLAQRPAFRRLPVQRLNLVDYWSADHAAADRTYATEAALIEGYEFDRVGFRVVGSTFRSADIAHWLALDVAAQALANAGYADGEALPKATTGVLLGNTLTGEFSRANVMRLRWPYVRRTVESALTQRNWSAPERRTFLDELEDHYKEPFSPIGEESLAGGLSNTIAGRICNYFDLNGGGYTVDGACASSLLAVANACTSLVMGDLDVALAGGVDVSLDPFELVGFAKTQALAPDKMRVYDARSAGFWPGEGCGFVVLMRLADALAEKRPIHAVIRGWGISSDGNGGITRPKVDGQLLAIQRAYQRAGFGAETVAYFEGHGTGTAVGDLTELQMLDRARQTAYRQAISPAERAAISSVKTIIGHTKAAAGVAGLIKATMALEQQILPPTTGCERPHPELCAASTTLRVLSAPELWPQSLPLRSGVSAMGFGGINSHVVLTGYNSDGSQQRERRQCFTPAEQILSATPQDAELFVFSANDRADLQQQIERVRSLAPRLSKAELTDLAAALQRKTTDGPVRAAIVADTQTRLAERLQTLLGWLRADATQCIEPQTGVFFYSSADRVWPAKIGFLFPGQGTPLYGDGGALGRRFDPVRALYAEVDLAAQLANSNDFSPNGAKSSTAMAQPAIVTASLAGLRALAHLGIHAELAVGHSLGELSALHWAGTLDETTLLRLATVRGRLMSEFGGKMGAGDTLLPGTMASIGADAVIVAKLLNGAHACDVAIACFNGPAHTVIAGEAAAVARMVECARMNGLQATTLPVAHAFHSPLMAPVIPPWASHLQAETFRPMQRTVISTVTGEPLAPDVELPALLQQQLTAPVRFAEAITQLAGSVDLLIEVGPGQVLAGLTSPLTPTPVVSIDAGGPSLQGLLQAVAAAYVLGAPVDLAALFADRFTRPFDLDWQPRFFTNPCELAPIDPTPALPAVGEGANPTPALPAVGEGANPTPALPDCGEGANPTPALPDCGEGANPTPALPAVGEGAYGSSPDVGGGWEGVKGETVTPVTSAAPQLDTLTLLRHLVAERVELPVDAIGPEDHLLSDLHLNSITVSQLVAEAARRLALPALVAPTEYANVTVAAAAAALDELAQIGNGVQGGTRREAEPFTSTTLSTSAAGVDTWVRAFVVALTPRPLAQAVQSAPSGAWQVIAQKEDALAASLQQALTNMAGTGVIVCLPTQTADVLGEATVDLLLEGARCMASRSGAAPRFVLVQRNRSSAAFARTLHLEMPHVTTVVVNLPQSEADHVDCVLAEATAQLPHGRTYLEAHYTTVSAPDGSSIRQRYEPVLQLHALADDTTTLPLGADDVLLVTGGGKGITAECALSLARTSGVRLALLGRSQPETDAALAANLARFDAAAVTYCYVAADITQIDEVQTAVQAITQTLGPITGILHGAASNTPKRIATLTPDDFRRTLAPKVQGLHNLLATIDCDCLRLLVAFGSIIARTGLPGEADYGLANEQLVALTTEFQQAHPACRCLAIEWSVWAGAGMGDRLGTLEQLRRQGITPIPLDEGVRLLHRLLCSMTVDPDFPGSVVVSGRMGDPPTVQMERPEPPFLRFLEEVRVHYPGVELVVDNTLSAENDPYLVDHVYRGERLLPAVMGLEAMAQVAMTLAECTAPPSFEAVQFTRPVVAPAGKSVGIRLAAILRAPGQVEVVLRCEETGFQVDHFRAMCCFTEHWAGSSPLATRHLREPLGRAVLPCHPQTILDVGDLYRTLLFHGARFQRLKGYYAITAKACVAEIATAETKWFARYLPADLVLGDPGARDAVIHAIQVCVPHATLLPVGVERLVCCTDAGADTYVVHARERDRTGDTFLYDVDVMNPAGQVVEQWRGLTLRSVDQAKPFTAWPAALLAPYLERRITELLPESDLRVAVEQPTTLARPARSDRVLQQALGEAAPIQRRADGRPETPDGRAISVAHAGDFTLAVAQSACHAAGSRGSPAGGEPRQCGPVGCDVEPVTARSAACWRDLLGNERLALAHLMAQEAKEPFDTAAARLWTVNEALRKCGATADAPLTLVKTHADGWVVLQAGAIGVVTYVAPVAGVDKPLALAFALKLNIKKETGKT